MSPSRRSVSLLLLIACAATLTQGCSTAESDKQVAAAINKQVVGPKRWFARRATVDDDDIQPLVRTFYKTRRYMPAWIQGDKPNGDARALVKVLAAAPEQGLEIADYDYDRLNKMMEKPTEQTAPDKRWAELAALDVELTRNFLKYATHVYGGQVNPIQLPADWHIEPRKQDMVKDLETAVSDHRVATELESLVPRSQQYGALRQALLQYRRLEANGGWAEVPAGPTLKQGKSGPRVEALQKRLAVTGDLGGGWSPGKFDAATDAAVKRFQTRHGLEPNGVVAGDELRELNVPVGSRVRQIELNMERWRWVPDSLLADRYLMVNIPEFALRVIEGGNTALAMRVVVGKQFSRTPMFSDEVTYLVVNPTWNVPASIAGAELLPEIQNDPTYLEKNSMRVYSTDTDEAVEVDPHTINWRSLKPEDFPYSIRQDPGPENPVGHVKFMCPNQFNVYLHDTPSGALFNAEARDFSHGCIRVEHPVELAMYLLRDKGWDAQAVAAAFDTCHNSSIKVDRPLPVRIFYWTAFTDGHGVLQFRDDVYGLDHLLDGALRSRRPDIKPSLRTVLDPRAIIRERQVRGSLRDLLPGKLRAA